MKLSVVIPACERAEVLRKCLAQVLAQAGPDYEVIVTDDSRSNAVRKTVEDFPGARWARGPGRGPAANRNSGASHARGEWLVFLDDDCAPQPGWLRAFDAAAVETVDVIEGCTVCPFPDRFGFYEIVENLSGGAFWSCNLAVRREVFETLRGFDEDFMDACAEDMEFAWRLRRRGLRSTFAKEARATHPHRAMGLRGLVKRTAAHRWVLLYLLKTGQAPGPDRPEAEALGRLIEREVLDTLRLLKQIWTLRDRPRAKTKASEAIWRFLSLPLFLPWYAWWEMRWRRQLAGRYQK